jgi:glycosyltransferase involved in cell wall biosynthesis
MSNLDISIVVPSYNEKESLPELCAWIKRVMDAHNYSYEIVLVDDGSTDGQWQVIEQLSADNKVIKAIRFKRNYGKSAALNEGFKIVEGEVVITMDADLQDSPDEIPELRKMILEEDFDIVSGWKAKRHDPISKTIPTKLYNAATRALTGIKLHDMNCGLKAYKNEVVKSIEVYGEMHRYIPVIAKWTGFSKIGEKVVQHQARKYGSSKFGLERFVNGFLDLLSITFVMKFKKKPMHFFGLWGMIFFFLGFVGSFYLLAEKMVKLYLIEVPYSEIRGITEQPLFFLSLLAVIIGVQMFLAGYLGELMQLNRNKENEYLIAKKVNL